MCLLTFRFVPFIVYIYHVLGLLDAVIAVPWIIQIGYVQALPLLLELSIEQGIMDGVLSFSNACLKLTRKC